MKRNQVLHNKYRLKLMVKGSAKHKRWRGDIKRKGRAIWQNIIRRVMDRLPDWGRVPTVTARSNGRGVERHYPWHQKQRDYRWRLWLWYCPGRGYGFRPERKHRIRRPY